MPVTTASRMLQGLLWHGLVALLLVISVYYIGSTVLVVWQFGWSEVFADQFIQYPKLLTHPFPENLMALDNGHRQVVSNLLRVADITFGDGDQRIGIVVGLITMLTTCGLAVFIAWRDPEQPLLHRASAVLLITIAVMWLGSARMQVHGNESFQVYFVILCALITLLAVEATLRQKRTAPLWIAVFAGISAMLSFGAGVGVFGLLGASSPRAFSALAFADAVLGFCHYCLFAFSSWC